ncbi:MAG: UDP-N-acetylmuramate dehydrogenase [Candidatus Electrothrix sp. AR4]|nr:UDP-N-acetylmuramate dehydrogenase [Candidatus Electrothrix sp. AR4]
MNQQQRDRLARSWRSRMLFDAPMASYSTLRAGGRADALVAVHTLTELRDLLVQLDEEQLASKVIGRGSNILVTDNGYPGVIIHLKGKFSTIDHQEESNSPVASGDASKTCTLVRTGAGCSLAGVVSWCSKQGLSGLEFMVGIPGSVGGALRMNAGAWGGEIGERLRTIELVDRHGYVHHRGISELCLSYRKLDLVDGKIDHMVITSATFRLNMDNEEQVRSRCTQYLERRRGKQPAGAASAGSFFKNPPGDSAGRLIEAAGLKGASCGQAMVSPVHANFIVNTGKATPTDIVILMEQIQKEVFQQFAVRLEPEVQIF